MMLEGIEFMGRNLQSRVAYWGSDVKCYPLSKIIHPENAHLDNHCELFDFSFADAGKGLFIGKYSTITWHALIEGGEKTYIGDRVFIGPGAKLLNSSSQVHGNYTVTHVPSGCRKIIRGDIVIGDDAYIGANSIIMPGVRIGEGAVIGANSFVKAGTCIEPWSVNVGTPCKKIANRERPNQEMQNMLLQISWDNPLWDIGVEYKGIREELN